ncbi:MAG: hypothetical protein V7711_08345 [Pseudomonadales bacterium]
MHPDDQQRVIDHKIPVNITTIWATSWSGGLDSALQILGEERVSKYHQQVRTAVDGGVSVSMGADVPSTDPALMGPLTLCEAAITRKDPSNPADDRVFPPMSQALTLEQCLPPFFKQEPETTISLVADVQPLACFSSSRR